MKYIVFSDSHGSLADMEKALDRERADGFIHLGDGYDDAQTVASLYPDKAFLQVPGNCDLRYGIPAERLARTDGVTFLLCHGHTCGVKDGHYRLISRARDCGAAVAMFGHTHEQYLEENSGVLLLNPGSVRSGYYAVIEFRDGKATAQLKETD